MNAARRVCNSVGRVTDVDGRVSIIYERVENALTTQSDAQIGVDGRDGNAAGHQRTLLCNRPNAKTCDSLRSKDRTGIAKDRTL